MVVDITPGPPRTFRYALIAPGGELSFPTGTFYDVRTRTEDGWSASTCIEYTRVLHPVAALYAVTHERPDTRRMNKVANGMFWELSAPPDPDEIDPDRDDLFDALADMEPADRIIKARGPVAFYSNEKEDLTDVQETELRRVHDLVTTRLKARGWL